MTLAIVAIVLLDVAIIGGLALLMRTAAGWGTGPREARQRTVIARRRRVARAARVQTVAPRSSRRRLKLSATGRAGNSRAARGARTHGDLERLGSAQGPPSGVGRIVTAAR